jgi:hypothetical protein
MLVYALGLAVAPQTAQKSALMPLIIFARLLLFLQMLLVRTGTGSSSPDLARRLQIPIAVMAASLVLRQAYLAVQDHGLGAIGTAVFDHPAVSALGIDLVLCAVSYMFWTISANVLSEGQTNSKKAS